MVELAVTDGSHGRTPRTFQPPPWERDAFEELARKREADEAAVQELDEAKARIRVAEEQRMRAEKAAAKEVDPAVVVAPRATAAPKLDDDKVELMLAQLSLEEPKMQVVHGLAMWSGVLLVVLGTAMLILSIWWQMSGMRNGAALVQLLIQSLLVGGFGVGFAVLGGMIVYQSRRQARS